MSGEFEEGFYYICANCGRTLTTKDFEMLRRIQCVYCGYRIVYKVRKPGVKKVKAI
ncbi:MAG: DNA-directed RNA polymerase subunit P [Fervidicoccaceae archaeon]|nr:DNA-directed RNA polymerase subunit P [Fervidicoccaceae archaeon]